MQAAQLYYSATEMVYYFFPVLRYLGVEHTYIPVMVSEYEYDTCSEAGHDGVFAHYVSVPLLIATG